MARPDGYDLPRYSAFLAARNERVPQLMQVVVRAKQLELLRQNVARRANRVEDVLLRRVRQVRKQHRRYGDLTESHLLRDLPL